MLSFTKTELLGLDIGSSAVKVVRLRKDDAGYTVTAAVIAEIAPAASFSEAKQRELNLCNLLVLLILTYKEYSSQYLLV